MSRDPGRLALVAALLLSAAPAKVDADQIDVRGNWQVNINCDLNATASIFLLLDEDAASGSTTVMKTQIMMIVKSGTRQRPSSIWAYRRRGVIALSASIRSCKKLYSRITITKVTISIGTVAAVAVAKS